MSHTRHTPGPWRVRANPIISLDGDLSHQEDCEEIGSEETDETVAYIPTKVVGPHPPIDSGIANARLIAASPTLLALAEHISLDPYALTPDQWACEARAAIRAATGEERT